MSLVQIGDNGVEGCIAPGQHREVIFCGATKTLVPADSGALVLLDTLAGSILTLPTPVVGMQFKVAVFLSVTSNSHIIKTNVAASEFLGGGIQMMIDTTAVSEGQFLDGTSHVTITMNGSTTGGLIGTHLVFTAVSATRWEVTGLVAGSGTLATPAT